jgi:Zn-dependent peptidase ImmA (M78 family)
MLRTEIEAKAREILRAHGMLNLAVDPVKLANALGARVYNAKFGEDDVHGLLARRDGSIAVYVNAGDPPVRKRFTIAHEIGHLVLHLGTGVGEFIDSADNFRTTFDPEESWTAERRREWEANTFAAALLMEEQLVRRMWAEIHDIEGLARWFQVSQQAMGFRLDALGVEVP